MLKKTLLAATIGHILCSSAVANNTNQEQYHVELETMTIEVENPFSQQVGTQKLTENQIKNRPTGNGNLSELLKKQPHCSLCQSH